MERAKARRRWLALATLGALAALGFAAGAVMGGGSGGGSGDPGGRPLARCAGETTTAAGCGEEAIADGAEGSAPRPTLAERLTPPNWRGSGSWSGSAARG